MSAPYNYQTDPSNYPGTPAGQQQLQRTQNQQTPYEYAQTLPQWSQIAMFLRLYNNIQDDKARGFDTTQAEAEWRQRVNANGLNAIITDIIDPWSAQGEVLLRANGINPDSLTPNYNNISAVRQMVQQGLGGKLSNSLTDANGNPLPVSASGSQSTTGRPASTVPLKFEDFVRQQMVDNAAGAYMLNAARRAAFNHLPLTQVLGPGQYSQSQIDAANNLYSQFVKQQQPTAQVETQPAQPNMADTVAAAKKKFMPRFGQSVIDQYTKG